MTAPYFVLQYEPEDDSTVVNLMEGIVDFGKNRPIPKDISFEIGIVSSATPEPKLMDWNTDMPPLLSPRHLRQSPPLAHPTST